MEKFRANYTLAKRIEICPFCHVQLGLCRERTYWAARCSTKQSMSSAIVHRNTSCSRFVCVFIACCTRVHFKNDVCRPPTARRHNVVGEFFGNKCGNKVTTRRKPTTSNHTKHTVLTRSGLEKRILLFAGLRLHVEGQTVQKLLPRFL